MPQTTNIHMALLDEGTDVWRRVEAEILADGQYRIVGPVPEQEKWEFEPGTIVTARMRTFASGESVLIAAKTSR